MADLVFTTFKNRSDAIVLADEVSRQLHHEGYTTAVRLLDDDTQDAPPISADTLVVSLGGDGTFLKSARLAHAHGARILAVNLGRLGFLLSVPSSEVLEDVRRALVTPSTLERLALEIVLPNDGTGQFALNEVVVERASVGHMVRVRCYVDDEEFLTYSADGVLVASPTGSTGYNFSAGGPVVDRELDVMVLTPIAPHFTIDRSIVVGGRRTIRLVSQSRGAVVVADGRTVGSLTAGESVLVRPSAQRVRVEDSHRYRLGDRLREGLREGHA